MRAFLSILILFGWAAAAQAATVKAENGRIVVDGRPITAGPRDSDPVLSPDSRRVVFNRQGPAIKSCSWDGSENTAFELWSVGADGSNPRALLRAHHDDKPQATICGFDDKQFSSDGRLLYFETPAWATSGALHVLDLRSGRQRYVMASNGATVLAHCRDPRYRDDLIVSQHRYFVFGGSYDWAFLFTPAGKEVGPLGDGDFTSYLQDVCG
ncbi:MAG: hypothetical protein WDN01_16390 [Rhizomicrobium sp.]